MARSRPASRLPAAGIRLAQVEEWRETVAVALTANEAEYLGLSAFSGFLVLSFDSQGRYLVGEP